MDVQELYPIKNFEGLYSINKLGKVYSYRFKIYLKPRLMNGYLTLLLRNKGKDRRVCIHRLLAETFIPNLEKKLFVDHVNRIRNDNRLENLRWCTKSENAMNSKKPNIKNRAKFQSKYKGVFWDKTRNKWLAMAKLNQVGYNLGRFIDEKEAAVAYNNFAKNNYGEFATLNTFEE